MEKNNARIFSLWPHKLCLLLAAALFAGQAQAQLSLKRQKMDSIAQRYGNEHAVLLESSHKLRIYEEDGELVAKSTWADEKLLISEKSLNTFNEDGVSGGGSFTYAWKHEVTSDAWIPDGNDYKQEHGYWTPDEAVSYTGLKKNSITRTAFVQHHEELRMLPGFYFSSGIPTLNAIFEVRAPRYVKMGFLVKGADTSIIKRSIKQDGAYTVYRFTAQQVPAFKKYQASKNERYYLAHVIPYIVSFRMTGAKKDSVLNGTVDAHHRFEYNFVKGMNYKTDSFLNKKTRELIRGAYTDREKVARIFDWVQKYFHYEMLYESPLEGFVPQPADTVCKRMYGDCKGMSSVLTAMYDKAGIESYCAVIGTDDIPYAHDEIHTQHLYNHMICAVKLDGEWIFPDGTTHVQPLGANRSDIQGKEAMIMMDKTHYKIVKIPEAPASQNVTISNTVMNIAYNDVTGTTYNRYSGYPAWDIAEYMAYTNRKKEKDDFVRELTMRGNRKFIVNNYNISTSREGNRDLSISTNYTLGDYVQQVKSDHFVNMNLEPTFTELLVKEKDRDFPMYLPYKKTIKETVVLNIPKGYRVTYLPKNASGSVNGLWSYKINYKIEGRTVKLTREYVLNTMKITPAQFEANNKLVNQLKKLYKETVVLTGK